MTKYFCKFCQKEYKKSEIAKEINGEYLCNYCYEEWKLKKKKEKLIEKLNFLLWTQLKCPYCNQFFEVLDFQFFYKLTNSNQILVKCPKCKKKSSLIIELEKEKSL